MMLPITLQQHWELPAQAESVCCKCELARYAARRLHNVAENIHGMDIADVARFKNAHVQQSDHDSRSASSTALAQLAQYSSQNEQQQILSL